MDMRGCVDTCCMFVCVCVCVVTCAPAGTKDWLCFVVDISARADRR